VFVALVIQHAKRMRRIILSSVACLAVPCFFYTLSHKRHAKRIIAHKTWILIIASNFFFLGTFFILRKIQRDTIVNIHRSFLGRFSKRYSNNKFHANQFIGRRVPCKRTDMTKSMFIFCNIVTAPKTMTPVACPPILAAVAKHSWYRKQKACSLYGTEQAGIHLNIWHRP
jgi:hypothetical protein